MTLAVVPARGGSRELRRKNLLPDHNGIPLVLVSARAARDAGCHVVVSTDDAEIESVATLDGHQVHRRGPELSNVPVDEVVEAVAQGGGPVLLVQPTVQPITGQLLDWFLEAMDGTPAALGVEDRHLLWHDGTVVTDRLERQSDTDWPIREMGVRWWPAGSPLGPPSRVVVAPRPLIDIDTAHDYQQLRRRLKIQFTIVANKTVGSGHLRRALTLAEGMQHHDVAIRAIGDIGANVYDILDGRGWPGGFGDTPPDVNVHDSLDLRHTVFDVPTVNLETTVHDGTVTVNAMYGHGDYTGPDYAVLRPEFTVGDYQVQPDGRRVMVLFGGTDPARLTDLALAALPELDVDVVRPGESVPVAAMMHNHDLLITSGGRTVFEAASVGIPTLVLCQNLRETTHTHLNVGNLNLGLGRLVDPFSLHRTVNAVLDDYDLRVDMSMTAKQSIDGRGSERVRRIIEHVGLFGEQP